MSQLDQYRFTDPEVAKCPFPYYAAMRSEDPVHLDPGTGWYWVTRHEDVTALTLDSETFSSSTDVQFRKTFKPSAQRVLDEAGVTIVDTFVTSDPPDADHYRTVAMRLFPPTKVQELMPLIEATAQRLIDGFIDRGEANVSFEYCRRIVGAILMNELDLPEEDLDKFKTWAECTAELMRIGVTEDEEVAGVKKMVELVRYLTERLERAVRDGTPGTAIHTLATTLKRDGSDFTPDQRSWMTFLTFTAANNTTVNMMNSDLLRLATNPKLQSELRANPDRIGAFVEEMLRLEGSSQALARLTTRDTEVAGTPIPKGSLVWLAIGSANRDECKWGADADTMNLDRPNLRRHMAFGNGRHSCIGMHLARAELNVTLAAFLDRMDNIRIADPGNMPSHLPLPFHRGTEDLVLRFDRR